MRINLNIFRILLPMMALLIGSATARAQDEEGVLYTLSTRCIPADAASTYPKGSAYAEASSVSVYYSANSGFRFLQWEDEAGNVVSTSGSFYYTMPAQDTVLIARFEYNPNSPAEPTVPEIKTYSTVHMEMSPADGGYIYTQNEYVYEPADRTYEVGTTANMRAYTNTGYRFVNWTEEGVEISTSASLSFTMGEEPRNIVANFVYDPNSPTEPGEPKFYRMLSLKANPEAAASSFSGAGEHINGTSFTVSATANPYFVFDNWTDQDGNEVSTERSFSYTMPNQHTTLTANFHYDFNPVNPGEPGSPSIEDTGIVGKPRMTMKDDTHVLILCTTPGATVYYTIDGTDPTTASDVYSGAIFVPGNVTVKAYAVKEGMTDSEVTTYQVKTYCAALPEFAFQNQKIVISTATEGAAIHYTIDNSDPTVDSPTYTAPLDLEEDVLVKAIATKGDLTDSDVAVFVFERANYMMEAPEITALEDGSLQITAAVEGAQIRYTIDGTDPVATSTLYSAPLKLDGNFTVKAYATHANYYDSPVSEYVQDGFVVEVPTLTYADLALTMATATAGAEIRYTVDGSDPTEESTLYSAPLALTEDCKVTARGFKANYEPSDTVSYTFVYTEHQVAAPVLTYDPEALTVTIACDTENAQIRYTIDGEAPTASTGTVYEGPVAVVGNHTYTARAFRADLFPSEEASVEVDDQQVPVPTATYADKKVTLACADEAATIHYTTDGTDPTAASAAYSAPLELTADCTVKFIAVREFFLDSEIGTYEFKVADHQVSAPVLTFDRDALTVTIACATENAQIRYTIDGEAPTEETGTVYEGPIAVTGNHTYTARAFSAGLFASEAATLDVNDLKVAKPTVSHSIETLQATMSTATPDAQIRYTTDGTVPTAETGTAYTAPIALTGNVTFTVRAFKAEYLDSDTTVYVVDNMKLPTPTATYGRHAVTIACEDSTAQVRYTLDGTAPSASSTLYTAPIPVTADCSVRFIATKTGFVSSDEGSYSFVLADWRETAPTVTKDFAGRKITLAHASTLPVSVSINGAAQTMATPATIDVNTEIKEISAVTLAQNEDRYDSESITESIVFHKAPKLTSDGHTLRVALGDGEPAAAAAELQLYVDGSLAANGASDLSQALSGFCAATARVQSDAAFISDIAELSIDAFNTGRLAGVRNGHRLDECIGTWGDKGDSYTYLRIVGAITDVDLKTLASLPALKTLHIDATLTADAASRGVFSGSRIETIYSNAYPEGMLEGMPRLTTVMWGRTDQAMPDGRLTEAGNPNILFWTPKAEMAPADAANIVVYSNPGNGAATDSDFTALEGEAESITLQAGYPFQAHKPVGVANVKVEKTFSLPTVVDVCAGWETITLPFDVEIITHEKSGRIVPFASWNGEEEDPKPFWLYAANSDGWQATDSLQAGVPYIISMPNNKDYVEGYNLAGKVTFSATNVTLGTDYSAPKTADWKEGSRFTGIFMPLEAEDYETGILSMNVEPTGDEYAGSAFTADSETLPFGAYVWAPGGPQSIPVFPDGSGVQTPTVADGGLTVETPAPGAIRISSMRACRVAIISPDGTTLRQLNLKAGESRTIEGLTRGLYIAAGQKVMVR